MDADDLPALLDAPSAAALLTYRPDGSADVSPVWYRATDSAIEIVIAEDDPKPRRIDGDDRVAVTVFETAPRRWAGPGAVIRQPLADARTWDLHRSLP